MTPSDRRWLLRLSAAAEVEKADAAVLLAADDDGRPVLASRGFPEAWRAAIEVFLSRKGGVQGKIGETVVTPVPGARGAIWLAIAGCGAAARVEARHIERGAAAAFKALRGRRPARVALFPVLETPSAESLPPDAVARRLVRGAAEGLYRFEEYRSDAESPPLPELLLAGPVSAATMSAARAAALEGATLNQVADLANRPGNVATPEAIAGECRRLAREAGLSCRIYDRAALRRERCGALLAVAAGSRCEPRVIVLRHNGAGAGRRRRPIVLLGKTLTFDSGGLSLKPGAGMEWMRYDKCGGMAALAATLAAARLQLPHPVIGILVAVENMPDGGATRPGDIVRTRSGKTVEILNTDAEGRLVLADALSLAADLKPAAIVDLATLTGAARIALGAQASALCCEDEALSAALIAAGRASGDRLWPLPMWNEYDEMLQTPFADLKNIGDGSAGTIAGAVFLRAFAPKGAPWAHVDIAATAWLEKEQPHRVAGATLSGARMLIEWLRTVPLKGVGSRP